MLLGVAAAVRCIRVPMAGCGLDMVSAAAVVRMRESPDVMTDS